MLNFHADDRETPVSKHGPTVSKINAYSSSQTRLAATGTHVRYGVAHCYLPPDRGDTPAFTPAN